MKKKYFFLKSKMYVEIKVPKPSLNLITLID